MFQHLPMLQNALREHVWPFHQDVIPWRFNFFPFFSPSAFLSLFFFFFLFFSFSLAPPPVPFLPFPLSSRPSIQMLKFVLLFAALFAASDAYAVVGVMGSHLANGQIFRIDFSLEGTMGTGAVVQLNQDTPCTGCSDVLGWSSTGTATDGTSTFPFNCVPQASKDVVLCSPTTPLPAGGPYMLDVAMEFSYPGCCGNCGGPTSVTAAFGTTGTGDDQCTAAASGTNECGSSNLSAVAYQL